MKPPPHPWGRSELWLGKQEAAKAAHSVAYGINRKALIHGELHPTPTLLQSCACFLAHPFDGRTITTIHTQPEATCQGPILMHIERKIKHKAGQSGVFHQTWEWTLCAYPP